jgi:hypothetical protein
MLRPLAWCLGLGAASSALTVATGGAAAPFAMALIGGVAGGAAGNFGHEVCKVLDRQVAGKLLEGRSGIAENHVVEQVLRLAQLKALQAVLNRFDTVRASDRSLAWRDEAQRFSAELAKFIAEQTKSAQNLAFTKGDDLTLKERELQQEVLKALPNAFDESLAARRKKGDKAAIAESLSQIRRMVETAVLAELRLTLLAPGEEPPPPFFALFQGGGESDGWFDLFIRDSADRIKDTKAKDGGAFQIIWNAEQIALVKAITIAHGEILEAILLSTKRIEQGQTEQMVLLKEMRLERRPDKSDSARESTGKVFIVPIPRSNWVYVGAENYKPNKKFRFGFNMRLVSDRPFTLTALSGLLYAEDGCICLREAATIHIDGQSITTLGDDESFVKPFRSESGTLLIAYGRETRPPLPEQVPSDCENGDLWIRLRILEGGKERELEHFFRYEVGDLVPLEKKRDEKFLSDAALLRLRRANLIDDEILTEVKRLTACRRYHLSTFPDQVRQALVYHGETREFIELLNRLKSLEISTPLE